MLNFTEYKSTEILMEALADEVATELEIILGRKKQVIFAVPGGATPIPFFDRLKFKKLEWSRVVVIPTDERFVSEDDPRSNSGLIRQKLIKNNAREAQLLSFCRPDLSIEKLAETISSELNSILPIDVCLLGMGSDMHTASIFPNSDRATEALDQKTSNVLIPISSSYLSERRLTLTAKVLIKALRLHLLFTGSEKKEAYHNAMKSKDNWENAPVRSVLFGHKNPRIHYSE